MNTPHTAVCIAGMHRSGTSMITRLMHMCGVNLGPEGDLLVPTADNPEGYWESRSLMMINDQILAGFGGGWDFPPALDAGWTTRPDLMPLRHQARQLLRVFEGQQVWGWKDPRNSLTMPFWRELIPNITTLVCLRNPVEVAASLHSRGYASQYFAYDLWLQYNRAVLANTTPENRIVTHYESYFVDPAAELRRVTTALGMSVSDAAIAEACATTQQRLRHASAGVTDLLNSRPPAEVVTTYMQLCNEAGPVYGEQLARELTALDRPLPEATDTGNEWADRWRAQRLEIAVQQLMTQAAETEASLSGLIGQLSSKEVELMHLRGQIRQLEAQLPKAS